MKESTRSKQKLVGSEQNSNGFEPEDQQPSPLYQDTWSAEKAWWLGVTMGDGSSRNGKGRRELSLKSEDYDLVKKWLDLTDSPRDPKKGEGRHWSQRVGDIRLTEWLASYGMDGKKTKAIVWPPDLPEAFAMDFIRGLWDTDGCVNIYKRKDRRDLLRCTFVNLIDNLVDGIVARVPNMRREIQRVNKGPYTGKEYASASIRGEVAVPFIRDLYYDAPAHLRCERKYDKAVTYVDWWNDNSGECLSCGRFVVAVDYCKWCKDRTRWEGTSCHCGAEKVIAKGLCRRCYNKQWDKNRKSWNDEKALKYLEGLDTSKLSEGDNRDEVVAKVLDIYTSKGFPWEVIKNRTEEDVLAKIQKGKLTVDTEARLIKNVSWRGQRVCTANHPHRLEASYRGKSSPVEAFGDKVLLEKAIRFQIKVGDPLTPLRLLRAVSAIAKAPTNLSPVLARWVVDTYGSPGCVVLDPCAGYGGRLLGTVSSHHGASYTGFDPEPRTTKSNLRMAKALGLEDRVTVGVFAVEDDNPWPQADLVFTGPPYYDREKYGAHADRYLKAYRTYEEWLGGFVGTLISKSMEHSQILVLNVGSFRSGSKLIDLPGDVKRIVSYKGFVLCEEWDWKPSSFGKSVRTEKLLVISR